MGKVELKPCPFCGGGAQLEHNKHGREYWEGFCPSCDYGAQDRSDRDRAIEAWNTRANDEEIARLREALQTLEQANEALCATRSSQTYRCMIDVDGSNEELAALDDARRNARWALGDAK